MKKILFLVILTSFLLTIYGQDKVNEFTQADTLRGSLSPLRTCYDVLKYDLDISIEIDKQYIEGSNTIRFIAKNDFQKMQLDLFANMTINKILFDSVELNFSRLYNAVFVEFTKVIPKDSIAEIIVYYEGKPQIANKPPWDGGFSWEKDEQGNPWVGVSCQHTGASCWWPCKDHQSDEPNEMFIRVSVPDSLMAVCNGRLLSKDSLLDGFAKYNWYVSYPINNYDVTLNIAKYIHLSDYYYNIDYKDTLTLDYFVLPYNRAIAENHFQQVKPMMECYYKLFGEYPFVKDGFKLVETSYLGMEHQSCIAYGNKYKKGYLGRDLSGAGFDFDYIIIHESAHEWWGNAVTTNDIADMWVHEGFGTYTEALYVECQYGYEAYLKYINGNKRGVANDKPIIGKYQVNNTGSSDMYRKGALLLHTLRGIIDNDSLFFEILKTIQKEFKYKTINTADVEKFISKKSGIDLSDVFNLYLRDVTLPVFEYTLKKRRGNLALTYRWASEQPFAMPLKVSLTKDQSDFIYPTNSWQTVLINNMKKEEFMVADHLFYIETKKLKRK